MSGPHNKNKYKEIISGAFGGNPSTLPVDEAELARQRELERLKPRESILSSAPRPNDHGRMAEILNSISAKEKAMQADDQFYKDASAEFEQPVVENERLKQLRKTFGK